MLRVILKRERLDKHTQLKTEDLFTLDIVNIELEQLLTSGGCGEDCYERVSMVGLEVKPEI